MEPIQRPPAISRKILPPHWFLAAVLLEFLLHRFAPLAAVIPRPWTLSGAIAIAAGAIIVGHAALLFRRSGTGIVPFSEASSLVVAGPYRFTRNPMYLGMALILTGIALLLGSATPFLVVPAFALLITRLFIVHEEAQMAAVFGHHYLALKQRVRRWI